MSNMQAFHEWLSAPTQTSGAYRCSLALLSKVSRPQILNIASDMIWVIWETDHPVSA
jgi:hypothetical protein